MPTLKENKSVWNDTYHWRDAGEEWSSAWGSSYMQWYGTILLRIHKFLPACTILEIAPGFGRWTEFLKDSCTNLSIVDYSEKCIKACRERFSDSKNISYFVNDGKSLDMIPDNSIDLIFSFDSLVHAEDEIILSYMSQFSKKLKQNGVAFIHHSNLGQYPNYFNVQNALSRFNILGLLSFLKIVDDVISSWRAPSMSAKKMKSYADENGLRCISQELITWDTKRILTDCISTIVKKDSTWSRDNQVFENAFFMNEAKNFRNLSHLYDLKSRNTSVT